MVTALGYPLYHRAAFRHAVRGGTGRNQHLRVAGSRPNRIDTENGARRRIRDRNISARVSSSSDALERAWRPI